MLEDNAKMLRALNALPPDDNDSKYLKFVLKQGDEQSNTTRLFLQMSIAGSTEQSLRALCEQAPDDIELQKKHQEALEHYQRFEDDYIAHFKSISPTTTEKEQQLP